MRVLHIGKYYPPFFGGIENFLQDLIRAQAASGLTVGAIVHNHDAAVCHTIIEQDRGAVIFRVPCLGSLIYAPVSPGFPVLLHRVIRQFKPDVIHVHMPNTSAFWMFLMPGIRHIPVVVHWHADVVQSGIDTRLRYAYPFYQPFEKKLLHTAQAVIATSRPYLATSFALAKWHEKTHVIPLGLGDKDCRISEEAGQWAKGVWGDYPGIRLLCVGRLTYYKGQHILVRAVAGIHDVRAIIVGQGELMASIREAVRRHKVEHRVTMAGPVTSERLDALFSMADCLVLPSTERTEAFGMVLLEAMRAAKPCIVFDVPGSGMGWVVKDQVTGLKVPVNNTQLLANAIQILAKDPLLRQKMGQNGQKRFQAKFHIHKVSNAISALYQSCR
jgi:glycosyltransferase involved in cell wall biosynthesis